MGLSRLHRDAVSFPIINIQRVIIRRLAFLPCVTYLFEI